MKVKCVSNIHGMISEHAFWMSPYENSPNWRKGVQADLRGTCLRDVSMSYANLCGMNLLGPELLDIVSFDYATVPEHLLPWLICHFSFADVHHTLEIVNEAEALEERRVNSGIPNFKSKPSYDAK